MSIAHIPHFENMFHFYSNMSFSRCTLSFCLSPQVRNRDGTEHTGSINKPLQTRLHQHTHVEHAILGTQDAPFSSNTSMPLDSRFIAPCMMHLYDGASTPPTETFLSPTDHVGKPCSHVHNSSYISTHDTSSSLCLPDCSHIHNHQRKSITTTEETESQRTYADSPTDCPHNFSLEPVNSHNSPDFDIPSPHTVESFLFQVNNYVGEDPTTPERHFISNLSHP